MPGQLNRNKGARQRQASVIQRVRDVLDPRDASLQERCSASLLIYVFSDLTLEA